MCVPGEWLKVVERLLVNSNELLLAMHLTRITTSPILLVA